MIIHATATVTFDYDTEDGLVTTLDEARDDLREYLWSASPGDFTIEVEEWS